MQCKTCFDQVAHFHSDIAVIRDASRIPTNIWSRALKVILPNISRDKDNQTMKFGQLKVSIRRNIFLEKLYTKYGGEASPRSFSKKSKLSITLDQQPEISYSLCLYYVQVKDYQNILKLRCWPLAFTSYKARFKEQQNEVLFNRFATRRKKSGLNLKYLKNEKRLLDEIKSIFRHF